MSARWSTSSEPPACSGDMYSGVPSSVPRMVRRAADSVSSSRGHAEVQHLDRGRAGGRRVADQEDVLGFEVAVDDPLVVRGGDRLGHLRGDRARLRPGQRPCPAKAGAQGLAFQVLHHDVRAAVGADLTVEDLHDSRVADQRRGARLVGETLEHLRVLGELGHQDLDRHAPRAALVLGQEHDPHRPTAELGDQLVVAERFTNHRGRAGS